MFDALSENLGAIFDRLTGRGALSEKDVDAAFDDMRKALLEADVALPVVRHFLDSIRPQAIGASVLKSVTPGQQIVKIVHDGLKNMLGEPAPISLAAARPVPIVLVGLQGSGKTTSTAKLAKMLASEQKQKILMASLDVARPAAMEQLRILGEQISIDVVPIVAGQSPLMIASRAMETARTGGYDVVLLDTAGRGQADETLMDELSGVVQEVNPHEIILVADSLTGQEAVNIAAQFHARLTLTGIILTRIEGDGRGGAALSMRYVTAVPIKYLGTGEALDRLEPFDAERLAGRILGMGDIVGLVEEASKIADADRDEKMAARMRKGEFTLEDLASQLLQMRQMGGLGTILGMLPGAGKIKKQAAAQMDTLGMDNPALLRQAAIVSSMTMAERTNPKCLNASRKKRIAAGSGTQVQDVNRLIKLHRQMADMVKKMGKGGKAGLFGGQMPPDNMSSPHQGAGQSGLPDFEQFQKQMGAGQSVPDFALPPKKKS